MKKILCAALALAMLIGVMPMTALAAEDGEIKYEVMIKPQYEDVDAFSNGLAPVKINGKWGYIDTTGKLVIDPQYDVANQFSEGKAIVAKNLDKLGEDYVDYYAIGFVDTNGKYTPFVGFKSLAAPESTTVTESIVPGWALFNYNDFDGSETQKTLQFFNGTFMHPGFSEGEHSAIYGVDGKNIVNENLSKWSYSGFFNEGLAVTYENSAMAPEELNIIDTAGKIIATLPMVNGEKSQAGYIFSSINTFNNGVAGAWVAKVDKSGGESENFYPENADFRFALVNTSGKIIFTGDYDFVYLSGIDYLKRPVNDGLIALRNATTKLWGAVDATGKTVVPFKYEQLYTFREGLAPAKIGGKFGYCDSKGDLTIAAKYDAATPFSGGYAVVVEGEKAYCIDRYGKQVKGSDAIDQRIYFPGGLGNDRTLVPGNIIVIQEDGKYGFAKMTYIPALPKESEMGIWYYKEAVKAMELGLVPTSLQNQYFDNIQRQDFAELIVAAIEKKTNKDISEVVKEKTGKDMLTLINTNKFMDTTDQNIIAASALGIINGSTPNMFKPYASLTREEAAALLMRTAKLINGDEQVAEATFADDSAIAVYAKDAISYVADKKIMSGTGNNKFSPKEAYTREQAFVTIYRLFEVLK